MPEKIRAKKINRIDSQTRQREEVLYQWMPGMGDWLERSPHFHIKTGSMFIMVIGLNLIELTDVVSTGSFSTVKKKQPTPEKPSNK